ncbi:thioredoxin family protein [Kitasatospora sp. NPDC059088]|uniref:thioredoxin family protein n=1 Tax=unclassified Kitasatospora TaxID=2633591 RepID=UPI0036C08A9C
MSRAHDPYRHLRKGRTREMSNTVELTKENFDDIVPGPEGKDFVLIDFWAGWCGPCRQFSPVYEKAAARHSDLVFAKVDTEAQQELAAAFGIQSIPTLAIIREGVLIFSQAGALPEPVFEDLIGQARELDMTEVKRKVAEEQAAEGQA